MKRSVRRLAWFAAVVGAIAAACGFASGFVPLVAIGLPLLCAGIWNISRPSITGLIVDGVAMILAGVFNGLAWVWIEDARASGAGKWILGGLVQIVWGIRRLALYPTAHLTPNDSEAIAGLESMVRELSKRDARTDPTVAEFRTGGIRRRRNRIGLYAEGAVALLEHQAVRLEKRTDIWIEASGTTAFARTTKVRIQMSDLQLAGEMSAEHFERFERWKLGVIQPRSIAA